MGYRHKLLASTAGAAVFGWSRTVFAAGGGGGESLDVLLLLVAVVGLAYLVAHLLLERFAKRFGVVTGVEYIVLGTIIFQVLAPYAFPPSGDTTDLQKARTLVEQLRPVLVLGTGSLGLMIGLHLDMRSRSFPTTTALRAGVLMSIATLLTVVALPALATWYLYSAELVTRLTPVFLCAGGIALVAADAPIRSMVSFLSAKGPATRAATRVARICSSFAVVVFGLIFCIDNSAPPFLVPGWYAPFEWLVIHLFLGGVLGLVFGTYLRRDLPDDQLLTVVIGMVVFTSGLAYGLHLSPIFVNFIAGIVLINTCQAGSHVRSMLSSIKYPLYIVLFIFAGAHLDLSVPYWAYALAGPYLLLRLAGRWLGDLLARAAPSTDSTLPGLGRVLLAPGGLSAAMAVDFLMVYTERYSADAGPFFGTSHDVAGIYTGLITAIVISEIAAYILIRSWLIDTADVSPARRRRGTVADDDEEAS